MLYRSTLFVCLFLISFITQVNAESFTYYPSGSIMPKTGGRGLSTGKADSVVHAPDILFPILPTNGNAKAYANSQVFNPGGGLYRGGDSAGFCDVRNYRYPWRDIFCELRDNANRPVPECPSGYGHQGQDLRADLPPPPCSYDTYEHIYIAVAVEDVLVENNDVSDTVVVSLDGQRKYDYLHMLKTGLMNGKKTTLSFNQGEIIPRGHPIGFISHYLGAPKGTTPHLHFAVRKKVRDGKGGFLYKGNLVYVNPYPSLVMAYERLIGENGSMLAPPVVCSSETTRCVPASGIYPKAALITCSADGTSETLSWCSGSTCSSAATCGPPSGTPPPDMASSAPHCAGIPVPVVTWMPKTALANPPKFDYTTVTVAQKKIHLFGPAAAGRHVTYDPTINSWSVMGPLPSGSLFPAIAATFKDAPYLYLQESGTPGIYVRRTDGTWNLVLATKFWLTFNGLAASGPVATYILAPWYTAAHLYSFNPDTNIWIKFPDRPQGMASAIVYKDAGVYAFGGDDGSAVSVFDVPTNTWYNRSPIPEKVFSAAAILWKGGLVMLAGGTTSASVPIDTVRVYNPAADTWCSSPFTLPQAIGQPRLQEIDGVLYVLSADGSLWEGVTK